MSSSPPAARFSDGPGPAPGFSDGPAPAGFSGPPPVYFSGPTPGDFSDVADGLSLTDGAQVRRQSPMIIGILLGICAFILISGILVKATQEKTKQQTGQDHDYGTQDDEETKLERETVEVFIDHMINEKPIRFSSKELAVLTSNYCTKLGSGGFGEVYEGKFTNGVKLAVKVLKTSNRDKRVDEQFMAEVGTLGRTHHRNLVRLYGFCFDANTKALVYEYMENGSLDMTLFRKKHELDWAKLWEIAIGVAKGLEYLHHYAHKRIIHYDVKPGNVLLDSEFCPKLADFGLAKLCNIESTHVTLSGCRGTLGYAAPELWMPYPVTYKCDVYSFGMMLFEIVGRRRNLDINLRDSDSQEWFPRQLWDKYDKGELEMVLADGGIEVKDIVKAKTMAMVALWCVQYLPQGRPSMSNVVKILEGEAQVPTPPNPFQHLIITEDQKIPSFTESNSSSRTYDGTIGEEKDHTPIMKKYEIEYAQST